MPRFKDLSVTTTYIHTRTPPQPSPPPLSPHTTIKVHLPSTQAGEQSHLLSPGPLSPLSTCRPPTHLSYTLQLCSLRDGVEGRCLASWASGLNKTTPLVSPSHTHPSPWPSAARSCPSPTGQEQSPLSSPPTTLPSEYSHYTITN